MPLIGVQFDKMRVTPAFDGYTFDSMMGNSSVRFWGLDATFSGLNITLAPGAAMMRGRYVRNISPETITVPANFNGVLVLTIDLTKNNDSTGNPVYDNYSVTNNQIFFRLIQQASVRQEDINSAGKVFDFILAYVQSGATAITTLNQKDTVFATNPSPNAIRRLSVTGDRIYEKIALNNVTASNKYSNCNVTLRRHGRICFAKINFKPVTTLAWEQLLDINGFPGYRPDGGDYGGILNEMSYNTDPGGAYIAGTTLRVMHVGRTDVGATNYSGVVVYVTNDDYPADPNDVVSGWKNF